MSQQTYTKGVRPALAVMSRMHVVVHRVSRGRVGRRWRGGEIVLLSTVGRRSGRRRTTPLVCISDGSDIVVVASNAGSDRMPDWWLNLRDRPQAELEVHGNTLAVVAEEAQGDVGARLTERFCRTFPCFREYRSRTKREIPVVLLRPAAGSH